MTTIANPFSSVQSAIAIGQERGLDYLRAAWKTANSVAKDESLSAQVRVEASFIRQTIESAGKWIVAQNAKPVAQANPWTEIRKIGQSLPTSEKGKAYYAIVEDGKTNFYQVSKPTSGKWSGRTFLAVQASDNFHPIRNPQRIIVVLSQIAAEPMAAMVRYGKTIGRCGACHRTLTVQESIDAGIGPVCAGKI